MMVKDAGGERGRTTVWRRWRVFKGREREGEKVIINLVIIVISMITFD